MPEDDRPVILLVDDERDLIEVLRDALGMSLPEYHTLAVTSLDDAEQSLAQLQGSLALVCVDHRLGERTGLEFLESLREENPHLPAILFTGQAPAGVEARAKRIGARVLWKPIGLAQWVGEVRQLLG